MDRLAKDHSCCPGFAFSVRVLEESVDALGLYKDMLSYFIRRPSRWLTVCLRHFPSIACS